MNTTLLIAATITAACSGLAALPPIGRKALGSWLGVGLLLVAASLGIAAAVQVLAHGATTGWTMQLSPLLPTLSFGLDALSATFLLPVCLLCACASVYDLRYWHHGEHEGAARNVRLFLGVLFASLILVLTARDGIAFLVAWELMALAGFFLVATEHRNPAVQSAAWIYLAATHAGTLLLVTFLCLWSTAADDLTLTPLQGGTAAMRNTLFVLALIAFGLKAGLMPLHFWLPAAHANAPSHVSAVLSGVLLKMGIYGLVRTIWLLPDPPAWWGVSMLACGTVSAVGGVAFAIAQHDIKRLLAYHSIENIGIIALGLGVLLLGRTTGRDELVALGLCGALLHTWNHGLFKGLLFFAAGATSRATGTREIDRLGGLARSMPHTAACFLVGAIAICGLPPLNGFVSELATYLGLFHTLDGAPVVASSAMVAIPALALVGAMALLCFVKVFGVVYLGAARTASAEGRVEAPLALRIPMYVLVVACLSIGLAPVVVLPCFASVLADWTPAATVRLGDLLPCSGISTFGVGVLIAAALLWLWLRRHRAGNQPRIGTWACGYAQPTPAMQYTASSFAQQFVATARLLLLPRTRLPATGDLFPRTTRFESHVPELVLDRVLLPASRVLAATCNWLRALQRGRVQVYVLFVFLTLLCLLLFT